MTSPAAIGVIPARLGSTRFPGKALAAETGLPIVVHVLEQARRATRLGRVLVAAPDPAILEAVRSHGGEAVLTREDHPNGTTRIAEARPSRESVAVQAVMRSPSESTTWRTPAPVVKAGVPVVRAAIARARGTIPSACPNTP